MSGPKERFYRHFQTEITAIQDQIDDLATLSPVGGERRDCIDHVLAGVSRLSNEVADAKEYIPAYDQRAYGQAVKALTDNLNKATGQSSTTSATSTSTTSTASKPRFQFKPRTVPTTATQATQKDKDTAQYQHDPRHINLNLPDVSRRHESGDTDSSAVASDEERDSVSNLPQGEPTRDYNKEMAQGSDTNPGVRKPSFSSARTISIYEHTGLHIILPSSASRATASGSLTDLDSCVVDMTVPTSSLTSGVPFAGLAVKNIRRSLLVCGTVAGSVHMTGVRDSIVVVAARQVRIHECENVDLYLHCGSHPIIEDCSGMRFAPIPAAYDTGKADEIGSDNQWNQVDDFRWLKAESSPNWRVLPEEARIPDDIWQNTVSGSLTSRKRILRSVGVLS
ncbi:tubulin-specific chaperone c protein [Apiospora arundinis]|uniref:Tubulin-specific chaperone C n=1 Tax=Apiospora arundinis TaxID=335852 RepID=A0ABR2HJG5_9PEZI